MTDLSEIKSVTETCDTEYLNFYLANGGMLLDTAGGRWLDTQEAHFLYSVGFKVSEKDIPKKPYTFTKIEPAEYKPREVPLS